MNLVARLFGSSIGRKFLMALTGLVLIAFVIGHLVGNLQVFGDPDRINGYAHFLQSLGPALWFARIGLLICVGIHIWASVVLTLESKKARGPEGWGHKTWLRATLASRAMRWTGFVVLAFIIYHLAHFTLGAAQTETFKTSLPEYTMKGDYHILGFTVVHAGEKVHDVHSMVVLGFQNAIVALFYIIAVGLLSIHLAHGGESLFQTLGWRNARWSGPLRSIVWLFAIAYFVGNLAIPAAAVSGVLQPHAKQAASVTVKP